MKCPFCSFEESKVIDSRPTDEGERIRRRRECLKCGKRFTTYEVIETVPVVVIKKDASRQPFDRNKLLNGFLRACEKRPVSVDVLESLVDEIESSLQNDGNIAIISQTLAQQLDHISLIPIQDGVKITHLLLWKRSSHLLPPITSFIKTVRLFYPDARPLQPEQNEGNA